MKNKPPNPNKKQLVKLPPDGRIEKSSATKTKTILLSHVKLGSMEVKADQVLIAVTDHHKIKALIIRGKEYLWFERTCSLDQLISTLNSEQFKRISKFYALNRQHCFSYLRKDKRIHFKNGYSIVLDHPFSLAVYLKFMR